MTSREATMTSRERAEVGLAVDLAILTVREDRLQVLVIKRGNQPYRNQLALPGGFLRTGEDLGAAAERELSEETGIDGANLHLEQLATYGAPDRDPRRRVVSVAYLAIAPNLAPPMAGSDASDARWAPVEDVTGRLAFDHDMILTDAVERARGRLEDTTLAAVFCGETFTVGELRRVYEVIWGVTLDPRNFNRKIAGTRGFITPTGEKRSAETGRPAALYRRGPATRLHPPMLRAATDDED